jgi:hypothetical protein
LCHSTHSNLRAHLCVSDAMLRPRSTRPVCPPCRRGTGSVSAAPPSRSRGLSSSLSRAAPPSLRRSSDPPARDCECSCPTPIHFNAHLVLSYYERFTCLFASTHSHNTLSTTHSPSTTQSTVESVLKVGQRPKTQILWIAEIERGGRYNSKVSGRTSLSSSR